MKSILIFLLSICGALMVSSCAHKSEIVAENGSANVPPSAPPVEESYPDNPRTVISEDEKQDATIITGLIDNGKLENHYEKIRINVAHARLKIETAEVKSFPKKTAGLITVKLLKGPSNCKIKLVTTETRLTLVDFMPEEVKCRFQIEISTAKPAELMINIERGVASISNWKESITVESKNADVDIAEVGPTAVKCERCTFSGSGVYGRLKYEIDNGNVGVEGLTATVDGRTLGDVVLKWNKVLPGSFIKVLSHYGDVFLTIPQKTLLALDLKVPKGEVYSNKKSSELVLNSAELHGGMPVSVVAETGNVRIIH